MVLNKVLTKFVPWSLTWLMVCTLRCTRFEVHTSFRTRTLTSLVQMVDTKFYEYVDFSLNIQI